MTSTESVLTSVLRGDPVEAPFDLLAARVLEQSLGPRRADPKGKDRVACLQVVEAGRALHAGDYASAERALQDARRRLEPKTLKPLVEAIEAARRAAARASALEALRGLGHLEPEAALAALKRALAVAPELGPEVAAQRRELEATVAERTQRATLNRRVRALLDSGQVFEAAEEAGDAPELRESVAAAMEAWATLPLTLPVPAKAGVIDIGGIGVASEPGQRVVVSSDDEHRTMAAAAGRRVALLDSETLAPRRGVVLPEGVSTADPNTRIFSSKDRVVIFDTAQKRVTVVDAAEPRTLSHRKLDRILAAARNPAQLAAETAFDPFSGRLIVNLPDTTGRDESRLLAIDPERGAVVHEERVPALLFNLRRVSGTNLFVVQRGHDPRRRPTQKPFHYLLVDGLCQTVGRVLLPELEHPLHAIRKMGMLPDGGFLLQYWYADPLTGQPVEHGNALIRMRPDQSILYASGDVSRWLGPGRLVWGAFDVPGRAGDLSIRDFALPWVAPQRDGSARFGLSGVSLDRFERRWDLAVEAGATLTAVFGDVGGQLILLLSKEKRSSLISVSSPRPAEAPGP